MEELLYIEVTNEILADVIARRTTLPRRAKVSKRK